MTLGLELSLFADKVPFIAERHYLKLPKIEGNSMPEPINDVWTALALLLERYNDRTVRAALRFNCSKNPYSVPIVRVGVYNSGYTRNERGSDYDFPITGRLINEIADKNFVEGIPRWGYTDTTELRLTERGKKALVDHLNTL